MGQLLKLSTLSRREAWGLLLLFGGCLGTLINTLWNRFPPLLVFGAMAGFAFVLGYSMIRWIRPVFIKSGLGRRQMTRPNRPEALEYMGSLCGVLYLLSLVIFMPFAFYEDIIAAALVDKALNATVETKYIESGRMLQWFPRSKLASYLFGILSLQSIVISGVMNELLQIQWKYQALIRGLGFTPLLLASFMDFGDRQTGLPVPVEHIMSAIAVFLPVSSNTVADIEVVEVGQALIIALSLMANSILHLLTAPPDSVPNGHWSSLYFLTPFIGISIALLYHAWYPSKVFVGHTYSYLAGTVFVIVGILGRCTKMLIILLIPQISNLLYASPQLLRLIPCPQNTRPRVSPETGLLEASMFEWRVAPSPRIILTLDTLNWMRLVRTRRNENGEVLESTNLTIPNLFLVWMGQMSEVQLVFGILLIQCGCGLLVLVSHFSALRSYIY
ncbi:putative UDP-N-acetylglucosamine-dolichyl-phosphate N-acetylglucosaminephosphate transferase [Aspergillus granulosus]|uniref:UDP-N-acetylglucosamine--dolichyl-phosphate N-acetylglucosaminephosphotransferase n=1 Tax=Aspergillus granulosus TaxID=176169 RepID=A0ABR4I7T0_9EURO